MKVVTTFRLNFTNRVFAAPESQSISATTLGKSHNSKTTYEREENGGAGGRGNRRKGEEQEGGTGGRGNRRKGV